MTIASGSLLEVSLVQSFLSNNIALNVFQYEVGGSFGSSSATDWANAWWNHVKTTYRLICSSNASPFRYVRIRELNEPAGDYGEYAIPTGEWPGTRTAPASDWLPMFVNVGVRLAVATRATRPGQKRFTYLTESDCDGTYVATGYSTALDNLMQVLAADMTLGAPVAGGLLHPIVTRKNPATGDVTAFQPVTGYIINNQVTSQVSRKIGRGI